MLRAAALSAALSVATALDWKQLPDAPWSGRSDACGGVLNGTIVQAGGHANSNYTNDVWISRDAGESWELAVEHAPWSPRSYHSCVVLPDDRFLLVAGHAGKEWFSDVWVTAPGDVSKWTLVTANASFPKRAAGSLQYQKTTGKLYYMGGSNGLLPPAGFGTTLYNDVWVSSDLGATWTLATPSAQWGKREGFSGQSSGNAIVIGGQSLAVIGGEKSYLPTGFYGDVWTSEDGANWTQQTKTAAWAGLSGGSVWELKGRSGHIVAQSEGTLWLAGGYLGRNDVWCINATKGSDMSGDWVRVAKKSPWAGRYDHLLAVVGNKLVLFGGENSAAGFGGPYYNDVWSADITACTPGA
eukprot:Hpha_TRINITY_DN15826_c1_g2::TRINITY_DN15826_c1_g2_i1::g.190076::m.190076